MDASRLEQSFLAVYDEHAEAIFRHCFFRVYDKEQAREIMQEAFTKSWTYVASGKKVKHLRALVYRIANNLIIDIARKKKEASLEYLMENGFAPRADGEIETQTDAALAIAQLSNVSEEYRDIIYMRYVDGLKPKEISEIMGISANHVSVRLHRGMAQLRKTIV